ncbi:hypothetical protein CMK12_16385 [Candidatus Poribacteria bacterium]|nr:hypothetical protein [Candidatus Poribacteria bacterium]
MMLKHTFTTVAIALTLCLQGCAEEKATVEDQIQTYEYSPEKLTEDMFTVSNLRFNRELSHFIDNIGAGEFGTVAGITVNGTKDIYMIQGDSVFKTTVAAPKTLSQNGRGKVKIAVLSTHRPGDYTMFVNGPMKSVIENNPEEAMSIVGEELYEILKRRNTRRNSSLYGTKPADVLAKNCRINSGGKCLPDIIKMEGVQIDQFSSSSPSSQWDGEQRVSWGESEAVSLSNRPAKSDDGESWDGNL